MAAARFYNPKDVNCIISDLLIDSGFTDGVFLEIDREKPDFIAKEGADGEVTRVATNATLNKITITLMQKSLGNAKLAALNAAGRKSENGSDVGSFLCNDRNGLQLFYARKAWVNGPPKVSYSGDVETRVWELTAVEDERFDG